MPVSVPRALAVPVRQETMVAHPVIAQADLTSALRRVQETLASGTPDLAAGTRDNYAHNERLAIRRARAAIRAGNPHLGLTVTRPLVDDLRWLARLLGEVRDLDVAGEHMAANCPADVWAVVSPALAHERAEALALVRSGLGSGRMERLAEKLDEAVALSRTLPVQDLQRAAARRARQLLLRLQFAANEPGNCLGHEQLHELRKLLRNLRYTLELLPEAETGEWFPAIHRELHRLQDWFGQIQDLSVQVDILERLRRLHVSPQDPAHDPLQDYTQRQTRERDRLVRQFPDVIAPLMRAIGNARLAERIQAVAEG